MIGAGRGVDHPPPSSAEVKEKVEAIHLLPLWAFVACSMENFTLLYITLKHSHHQVIPSATDHYDCQDQGCKNLPNI